MTLKRLALIALANLAFFTSCSDDIEDSNTTEPVVARGDYDNGLLISHEGNFFGGNASISYVSNDLSTVENNVFENINNELLGDTAQSMAFNGDLAFSVVNVSNKIEVFNRYTFQVVGTIDAGLDNPRYMAFANGNGYVTNWGDTGNANDDYIAVIDLNSYTVTSTILVSEGPEQIVSRFGKLYTSHSGAFNNNNVVSVIDSDNTSAVTYITVEDKPDGMVFDSNGNLIVLSKGQTIYDMNWNVVGHTDGAITKISTVSNLIESSVTFANGDHPSQIAIDGTNVYYYLNGSVYKIDTNAMTLPANASVSGLSFYGMSVKNGVLYGVDAGNFSSNGFLRVYDLATGNSIDDIELSIIPSKVYFN